jgi:hypothetical protein
MKTTPTNAVRAIARALLVGIVAGSLLSACGGGGGGDSSYTCAAAKAHITPLDGSSDVPVTTTVTLTVENDTIDCASLPKSSFTLATTAGALVAGAISCNDTRVTFTPDATLAFATQYVAHISTMKNGAGEDMCTDAEWRFTTAAEPAFAVVDAIPAASATSVGIDTKITVNFSGPANCATVNATTFKLLGAAAVNGTVSCSGSTATFSPNALLASDTQYTASLEASVAGSNGVTLGTLQSWTFTTSGAGKVWIKDPLNPIGGKSVEAAGADGAGNVMLLYRQHLQNGKYMLTATRYKRAPATPWLEGWWFERDIWSNLGTSPAQVAVSKNGNAVVVAKTDTHALNFHYYTAATGTWGQVSADSSVASLGGSVTEFQPVIDDNGNAMLVWSEASAGTDQVYARYYNATTGVLGGAQTLGDNLWPHRLKPRFSFAPNGNGTVVFAEWQGVWDGSTAYAIGSRDYDAATDSWSAAVTQITNTDNPTDPDIAIDGDGNAVVVWAKRQLWDDPQFPPAFYYQMVDGANRAAGSPDWAAVHVGVGWDPKGDASNPHVVMMPNGDALATWTYRRRGETDAQFNAAYHVPGSDWGPVGDTMGFNDADHYAGYHVLWTDTHGGVASPSLVVDKNGKVTLVYSRSNGTHSNVYMRTFSHADRDPDTSGWSDSVALKSTDQEANGPVIAVDDTGTTMTIWNQWNPSYSTPMNDFWYLRQ